MSATILDFAAKKCLANDVDVKRFSRNVNKLTLVHALLFDFYQSQGLDKGMQDKICQHQ